MKLSNFFFFSPCKPLPYEEIKFNSFHCCCPGRVKVAFGGERSCPPCHCALVAVTLLARATQGAQPGASHAFTATAHGAELADTLQCCSTGWGRQQSFHPASSAQG